MRALFIKILMLGCVLFLFHAENAFSAGWFSQLFSSESTPKKSKTWGFKKREKQVKNQLYREECGACHWAFLPRLLYRASWKKIVEGLEDHFGEEVLLEPEDKKKILAYLLQKSLPISRWEKTIPIRVTDRFRKRKGHRGMKWRIKRHPEVKTFSNCPACHQRAEYGKFGNPHD